MRISQGISGRGLPIVAVLAVLLGSCLAAVAPGISAASPPNTPHSAPNSAVAAAVSAASPPKAVTCISTSNPDVAAKLARDIRSAEKGRSSHVAVWVDDPGAGITCSLDGSSHFDSASIVKVVIMGAMLRKVLDEHRYLTNTEVKRLRAMIMKSDNDAASALWKTLGHRYIRHFLELAKMKQTVLGPGRYWGLTQATAHDEMLLLRVLLRPNQVLANKSRVYAQGLMAQVIPSQRWGVPAGSPKTASIHVKNGWLPRATHGWRINSIGGFTWPKRWYSIVVLSTDNRTMPYGITTVESIARMVHRDLNPTVTGVVPPSTRNRRWGKPDESIPAQHEISGRKAVPAHSSGGSSSTKG